MPAVTLRDHEERQPSPLWAHLIACDDVSCRLREACALPTQALAALIAREITVIAFAALELSGDPVHDPVHGRGAAPPLSCYDA